MSQNIGIIGKISKRPGAFALAFIIIFILLYGFLSFVGATPDPIKKDTATTQGETATSTPVANPQEPVRIVARDIKLDTRVSNPSSTDIDVLDQALLVGAVRYPTSALLGVDGTVLLFGHSSYLPVVRNQAYKTFDGIQDLKPGQIISVYSNSTEYRYSVVGVKVANAKSDVIELPTQGKHLTLVTCDSFTSKSNRFVVTADFVGAYSAQN